MTQPLETIFQNLPDPIFLISENRNVVFANRAATEVFGDVRSNTDLAMTIRHPQVLSAVDAALTEGERETEEFSIRGSVTMVFDLHAVPLGRGVELEDGSMVRALISLHDKTGSVRSDQMRADFVANASHELRSPLSSILGFVETLRGSAGENAEKRERFLRIMQNEAERMNRLIDDLMSLSRVEIDEHVRPRQDVDVSTALTGVRELLVARANARNMTIDVTGTDQALDVIGDNDQVTQVFRNLVENAINYGHPGTTVEVTAETVERIPGSGKPGVAVHVVDHGEGIPREHIPRLTERFYRVDQARSAGSDTGPVSTGLGLAIVKHIVNRHRGRLRIESEMGRGSRFSVFLPRA